MEYKNKGGFFLTEEEIGQLALYLAYGSGLGVWIGLILNNVPLYFSIAGVGGIIYSLFKSFINRHKEKEKI